MVLVAPRSAKLVEAARRPVHAALRLRLRASSAFADDAPALEGGHRRTGRSGSATSSSAIGVGLAGTPASHSLTGSVPVRRAGMASGTADLQRDLGGAIMQSIFGALLTAGYAAAAAAAIASSNAHVTTSVENQLTKSFDGAEAIAQQYPQYASQIIAARQGVVPGRRPVGVHGRARRGRCSAPCSSSSASRQGARAGAAGAVPRRGQRPAAAAEPDAPAAPAPAS